MTSNFIIWNTDFAAQFSVPSIATPGAAALPAPAVKSLLTGTCTELPNETQIQ